MDALPQNYSASSSEYQAIPAGGAGVVTPSRIWTWDMDCQEVGAGVSYRDSAYNNIAAAWLVLDALGYKRDSKTGSFPDSVVSAAILSTTVVAAPKHGRLLEQGRTGAGLSFQFSADSNYQGMDQFGLRVDALDKTGKRASYLLNYKVAVVDGITNEELPSACERWMKQSRKSASVNFPVIAELGSLLDARLAETYELGIDARIILNDSSAINWYLDPTPLDNTDDFLPTADKTLWRAKAGSAADGQSRKVGGEPANPNDLLPAGSETSAAAYGNLLTTYELERTAVVDTRSSPKAGSPFPRRSANAWA